MIPEHITDAVLVTPGDRRDDARDVAAGATPRSPDCGGGAMNESDNGGNKSSRELAVGSLFSGYSGLEMGVGLVADTDVRWHSEIDPNPAKVLAHHYPDTPNLGDITKVDWADVEPVDLICGGFPCQDISMAGLGAGIKEGTRSGLWYDYLRAVRVLRPRHVFVENVSALLVRGLDIVLAGLAEIGYDARWVCLRASDAGAPHRRERLFVLATDASGVRGSGWGEAGYLAGETGRGQSKGHQRQWDGDAVDHRGATSPDADLRRCSLGSEQDGGSVRPRLEASQRDDADGCRTPIAHASHVGCEWSGEPRGRRSGPADDREPAPDADCSRLEGRHDANVGGCDPASEGGRRSFGSVQRGDVAWGDYEPAIRRWEAVLGRRAPAPVDSRGRLSPSFVEWMMGLPEGWVTGPLINRSKALKALGNGVVPQQAAMAFAGMTSAHSGRSQGVER